MHLEPPSTAGSRITSEKAWRAEGSELLGSFMTTTLHQALATDARTPGKCGVCTQVNADRSFGFSQQFFCSKDERVHPVLGIHLLIY